MKIQIKVLSGSVPEYSTLGSAAVDLRATEDLSIGPGDIVDIKTGVAVWIGSAASSKPLAGLLMPRSGLGSKGLILANTIGLIDEDYQAEILVKAWNRTTTDIITIKSGDRIAQLMFVPVIKAEFEVVEEFSDSTARGHGGFGSTGV